MLGWFRVFVDPEIARIEAVPRLLPGRAVVDVGGLVAERGGWPDGYTDRGVVATRAFLA